MKYNKKFSLLKIKASHNEEVEDDFFFTKEDNTRSFSETPTVGKIKRFGCRNICQDYDILEEIGKVEKKLSFSDKIMKGFQAQVFKVQKITTKEIFAAKMYFNQELETMTFVIIFLFITYNQRK